MQKEGEIRIPSGCAIAAIISKEITDFALNNNVDNRNAQVIGLASEEFVSNIISYGYKNNQKH